jgi:predicted helicase
VPKSWDEFEDIVWELYARLWHDPNAQRHGRSGQRQQGVDIYGQPEDLGGQYVGIQCKRYEDGSLTRAKIEKEIAEADQFRPPLAEYIIATTEHLDAKLQTAVCQFSPDMGPSIFGQGGPLPKMASGKFLLKTSRRNAFR